MPIPLVTADSPNMKCPSGGVTILSKSDKINLRIQQALSGRSITFTPIDDYRRNTDRVFLECQCGHKWDTSVNGVLRGYDCPKCARAKIAEKQRLSLTEVNERLKKASSGRYSFKEVTAYKNGDQRVECECNVCHHQWSNKYVHLVNRGQGCPKCAGTLKLTYDEAFQRLANVAKDRYIFKLKEYTNNSQRVQCKCLKCGYEWSATYYSLVGDGHGCKRCGHVRVRDALILPYDETLARLNYISQERFTFTLSRHNYSGLKTLVLCRCLACNHLWITKLIYLIQCDSGCPECAKLQIAQKQKKELVDVINELCCVSEGKFAFTLGKYNGIGQTRIDCECYKCGETWNARLSNLIYLKNGCPNQCFIERKQVSKPENEIVDYIKQHYPNLEIQQSVRSLIKNLKGTRWMEIDIYIPELKLAFEFNGIYYHSDEIIAKKQKYFDNAQQYHDYKTDECAKLGIKLVHIDEADWRRDKSSVCNTIIHEVTYANTAY